MQTFLIVVAAIVVGLPLAVVIAWQVLKWKLKKAFGGVGEAFKQWGEAMKPSDPLRLTLERDDEAAPKDDAEWSRWVSGFAEAGLESVGVFRTPENPAVVLHGFVDERRRFAAVVYRLGAVGPYADVASIYPDGRAVTHTSSPDPGLDQPEWRTMVRMSDVTAADLIAAHVRERHVGEPVAARASDFKPLFERAYAREMDWRMVRGITRDEARRQLVISGTEPTDDMIEMTVGIIRGKYDMTIDAFLKDEARKARGLTKEVWEEMEPRSFVISDRTTASDAADQFVIGAGWDQDETEETDSELKTAELLVAFSRPGVSVREAFRKEVAKMTGAKMILFVGSAKGPIDGDVYVGVELGEEEESRE